MYIRYELSLHFWSGKGLATRKKPENKGFSRARTLGSVGFTPNMGYLHDEPVEASPPSRRYRLRKFARKHRRLIATAAGFVLLVAAGAGVSTWQALRARAAEREALTARDDAAEQLRQSRRSEARANAVLQFFQDKVLSAARPKGQEGGISRDATVREALDRAEPEIAAAFAGEPLAEASIRNTLGVSYWYLGDQEKALEQQQRAVALRRQELGPEHPETVGAMNDLAIVLDRMGKFAEEQKILEVVVAVKRRTLGPEDPLTLRSVNNLAVALALQGLLEDAVKLLEETLEIQRRVEGPESIFTLRTAYNLAIMRRHLGRWAEARSLFDETLQTLRRVFGPDHQDTLRVLNYLGELLLDQRRPAEARALFEEALKGLRLVLGPTRDETILTMINLADTARLQGRLDEVRGLAEEADALNRLALGPDHPQTLFGLTILSSIARDQGRLDDARKGYEKALAAFRRTLSARTPEVQRCMVDYAWMLAAATEPGHRDPHRAIELANEVIRNSPKVRDVWTTLGVAHYRAGAWKDAIAAIEKSEAEVPGCFTAVNGFFLAMAYGQLGEQEKGANGTRRPCSRWRRPVSRPGESWRSSDRRRPTCWTSRTRSGLRRATISPQAGVSEAERLHNLPRRGEDPLNPSPSPGVSGEKSRKKWLSVVLSARRWRID